MANGLGPAWIDTAAKITTQVGVPTVFAAVLLWFVLTRLGSTLATIEDNEIARTKLIADTQEEVIRTLERQIEVLKDIQRNRSRPENSHE